ncbi:hydroxyacid dehydrogenase [Pelagibacteraceae bacterium]|nr:hydroxyacid dehydrogenase [Pelagibacteraceae bacterium]
MKIAILGNVHNDGWDVLRESGFECFEISNFDENNLKIQLADVHGVLLRTSNLNSKILSNCKNLKIIARHGVGYDNVDLNYLNKNKIALGITGTSNAVSVAEHVLTSFLYLTKNIHLSDKLTREGKFKNKSSLPNFFELYQKNVLILGFGRIGKEVAKRCKGFDANVYVYDPFVENKNIENSGCISINKEEGIRLADYITVHLPLNANTKNFISSKEFSLMKKNSIIVNSARGGIINEQSLIDALEKKNILAAGIDVFEKEPPDQNNPLFKLSNILLSPHNAALTLECRKRMATEAARLIVFYLTDKKKLNFNNLVNLNELDL